MDTTGNVGQMVVPTYDRTYGRVGRLSPVNSIVSGPNLRGQGCCGGKTLAVTSFIKAKLSGKVDDTVAQERLSICQACKECEKDDSGAQTGDQLFRMIGDAHYCGKPWIDLPYRNQDQSGCGCNLDEKVQWKDAACPRQKWGEVTAAPTVESREMTPPPAESKDMPRGPVSSTYADFDLYVSIDGLSGVCYFGTPSINGLTLNNDAFPACANTPTPPEQITGNFSGPNLFYTWYSQNSACSTKQAPDIANFILGNTGSSDITVVTADGSFTVSANNSIVVPGPSNGMAFAGFGTKDQSGFSSFSATFINVQDPSVCWVLTGKRENGKAFRIHGPGRPPTHFDIPTDVDEATLELVEDGMLIDRSKYKINHAKRPQ